MNPSPEPNRTISQFEKLLADLARSGVDFAVVGGLAVILNGSPLKQGSWREKDQLDVSAMKEILAREPKKS